MAKLVVAATFLYRHEALVAAQMLWANGVPCLVDADDAGGWRPFQTFGLGGVQLRVDLVHLESARQLLAGSQEPRPAGRRAGRKRRAAQ